MKTTICVAALWFFAGLSVYAFGVALAAESAGEPIPFMAKFIPVAASFLNVGILLVQIAGGESWLDY